jgi:hypothetical protein
VALAADDPFEHLCLLERHLVVRVLDVSESPHLGFARGNAPQGWEASVESAAQRRRAMALVGSSSRGELTAMLTAVTQRRQTLEAERGPTPVRGCASLPCRVGSLPASAATTARCWIELSSCDAAARVSARGAWFLGIACQTLEIASVIGSQSAASWRRPTTRRHPIRGHHTDHRGGGRHLPLDVEHPAELRQAGRPPPP